MTLPLTPHTLPHNLPPRSEFIGREKDKALVHEALRSRSYLISIDGIGGIGKTSLALEVAYECWLVSQHRHRAEGTGPVRGLLLEDVPLEISPALASRLSSALLTCGPFHSDTALRAAFMDARLSPWRDKLPHAKNPDERVQLTVDLLRDRYSTGHDNALILLLRVLDDQTDPGDACHRRLAELAHALEESQRASGMPAPSTPAIPPLPPTLDRAEITRFDGYIWTTAKDRELSLEHILDAVARTLDYPGIAQKPLEEKRLGVERLLRAKPYLLLVDNFETISDDAVRDFLLNLPEPSKALITTREQKLDRVWAISLKGLTEEEALALMRSEGKRLGMWALERAEDRVLLRLYEATGGAPLAIKWAVGQITQRGQSLDTVLAALHEARGNIFDNIFGRSWELLTENARKVLMVMPLFATSASRAGIEAASDVHHFALDEALGKLVEMSLVSATDELELTKRRYSIHSLTRAFAAIKLQQTSKFELMASKRLAKFLLSFAKEKGGFWNPRGFRLLDPELPNVLKVIQWCYEHQFIKQAMDIFYHVTDFMTIRGYWNETMVLGQQALEAALELQDEIYAAAFRVWPIAWLNRHQGNLDLAERQVTQALSVLEQHKEDSLIAYAKRNLGRIAHEKGELKKAEQILTETLEYYKLEGNERHIHFVTGNLAAVALERGELDKAWSLCRDILNTARQLNDPERLANLLGVMGNVAQRRGDLAMARSLWQEALDNMRSIDRLDGIADCLLELSRVEMEMGNVNLARQMLLDALESYQRLDVQPQIQEVETIIAELEKDS